MLVKISTLFPEGCYFLYFREQFRNPEHYSRSGWKGKLHFLIIYTFQEQLGSDLSPQKVAYIFKVFGAQSCLMFAQQFDQIICVCDEYNNFQDSKFIYMISDFKIFPIMLLRHLIWYTVTLTAILDAIETLKEYKLYWD